MLCVKLSGEGWAAFAQRATTFGFKGRKATDLSESQQACAEASGSLQLQLRFC